MEKPLRKPFEGVIKIIQFNYDKFLYALCLLIVLIILRLNVKNVLYEVVSCLIFLLTLSIFLSLIISFYIYDCSDLYKMNWLNKLNVKPNSSVANISAGFDETSLLLIKKLRPNHFEKFDFYNEGLHTEKSIKVARRLYPPSNDIKPITTSKPFTHKQTYNYIFLIFSAHEIRNNKERSSFFCQLKNQLSKEGKIIVVEHRRDFVNFLAYNVGFFHFLSQSCWLKTFEDAGCYVEKRFSITPFVQLYLVK